MSPAYKGRAARCFAVLMVLLMGAGQGPAQAPASAGLDKLDCSLKWIPADAAFYSTMLRNGEQWAALTKSKAWARLTALPGLKELWKKAEAELNKPGTPLPGLRKLYEQPENQRLVELLGDLVYHEVFFYGGETLPAFVQLLAEIQGASRFGPALAQLTGQAAGVQRQQLQLASVLEVLAENPERIKVPDLIIGFKTTKVPEAQAQLKRLEELTKELLARTPLKGRLQREKLHGGEFLTLTLDGSLVPWDEVPFRDFEERPGQYDALKKKLKELKLTIRIGIRESYVLLCVGESDGGLAKLGRSPRLADRPELQRLAKFADKKVSGLSYVSQGLNTAAATTAKDIDDFAKGIRAWLPNLQLTEDQKARIDKDIEAMAKDLKRHVAEPGPSSSVSFLTDRGEETFTFDWSQVRDRDASKPLTLLNHLGGAPILAVVGRSKYDPEAYATLVKWIKKGHAYVEEFGVPQLDPAARDLYERFMKSFTPLFRRVDAATGQMLLPALADGQAAFVLDAKLSSKQWLLMLPETPKPMPMVEPALVLGVSDAGLLVKACREYRAILNDAIARMRELVPFVPLPEDFKVPEPAEKKVAAGRLFFYSLPAEAPVDRQLVPTAGLSDKVAALTISHAHAERLLTPTPLKVRGGPLADAQRPLSGAVYFDWPALVDAATPWIEMGVPYYLEAVAGDKPPAKEQQSILDQVRTVLEVLKCFRGYTSCTYLEDKVWVTHGEMVFQDIR